MSAIGIISGAMAIECTMDATFFWTAPFWVGLRGNRRVLVDIGGDDWFFLASAESRRVVAGALSGLGHLCRDVKLHHLAA